MSAERLHTIYPPLLQRARELRHPQTPAEQKVWFRVRNSQTGFKIRRQTPIDRFIADFYCAEARLLIEIDGDTHAAHDQAEYDSVRTAWLEDRGYKVIRFRNEEVYKNLDSVICAVQAACKSRTASSHYGKPSPPSLPSPGGRGVGGEGESSDDDQSYQKET